MCPSGVGIGSNRSILRIRRSFDGLISRKHAPAPKGGDIRTREDYNMEIRGIVTTTVLILALITISTTTAAATTCTCGDTCDICVNTTGWWNCGGAFNASTTPIQAAVNAASGGDTICVAAGSYSENVGITTAHLTLEGAGADNVTVTALTPGHVFEVTADYVNISGFTATGAASYSYAGIHLDSADNCNISDNNCSYNDIGILLDDSSNNMLASNNASLNYDYGIRLNGSSNYNTLASNNCSYNFIGILLEGSSNYNTLASNNCSYNDSGILLNDSSNNMLASNNCSYNDYGILLDSSSNYNTLTSNNCSYNFIGILLDRSSNYNTLTSNNCSYHFVGILLGGSSNYNTLASNNCSYNDIGILLEDSSSNVIYNNYFNNTANAIDNGINQWNITKASGANIIDGPYLGGNYWSDYAGNDTDGDCLGDTLLPYNSSGSITNGGDYHPLVPCADTTPPVITITMPLPYGLYTVGMTLIFSATDESGIATIVGNLTNTSGVSWNVNSSDNVSAVGVYTLVVTATDNACNTNVSDPVFFVVYDPDGGHATGGGWFYPDNESTLPDGKANFGFTAKYKDDNSTGKLNFQYSDADIHLKSTSIDWLTISSVSAQFQGTGTINGDGLYTFRVKAKDNGEPGAGTDHFDIKIWNGTNTEADPYHKAKNTIAGGNIQVHTN